MYNRFRTAIYLIPALLLSCTTAAARPPAQQPNLVVIFADDMGYGDMSCNGNPTIRTPHLDRMAMEGQKWTNFYVAASVCTPSRAGLMTGRLPIRSGMCSNRRAVLFPDSKGGMPPKETTIAEMLKDAGYATGMVGKWHLGHLPQFLPTSNGFDSWWGIPYSNDMDQQAQLFKDLDKGKRVPWHQRAHWKTPKPEYYNVPLMDGEKTLERGPDQNTITKRYTEKSIDFIKANKDKPFFLYLAHSMPHVPLFRSKNFENVSTDGLYGDVIEELDWSVGQIMQTLKKEGIAENTLVVFSSDNGPWLAFRTQGGIAGPLKDGKGSSWEGGVRVPGLFWWPGTVKPAIIHGQGSTLDLMATAAKLSGAKLPTVTLDSFDLTPTLLDGKASPRNSLVYYNGEEVYAIRNGRYKAHFITRTRYNGSKPQKHDPPLLFDLNTDPGEQYDLAQEKPEEITRLTKLRDQFLAKLTPGENQLEKR